jgi:predicted dehydrogenase
MTVRIGIVGASLERSWAARAHIPALMALDAYEIAAVCTTRQASAHAAARYTGAGGAYTDARALAADPDVDVVAVCVKVPQHREAVLHALEAGKHVYCEWPLGADADEAQEMADAAGAAGVISMVGLQAQASPAVERARELIAEGYLGRLLAASLTASGIRLGGPTLPPGMAWAADRSNGASVLTIPAGHAIDALFSCAGEPADVVACIATQTPTARDADTGEALHVTAPDQVVLAGTLAGGGAYSVHAQGGTVGSGFRLSFNGTDGMLVLSTPGTGVQHTDLMLEIARDGEDAVAIDLSARRAALPEAQAGNVAAMYQRLAHAIRTGEPAHPDFHHALKRQLFLELAVEASDSGVRQRVVN